MSDVAFSFLMIVALLDPNYISLCTCFILHLAVNEVDRGGRDLASHINISADEGNRQVPNHRYQQPRPKNLPQQFEQIEHATRQPQNNSGTIVRRNDERRVLNEQYCQPTVPIIALASTVAVTSEVTIPVYVAQNSTTQARPVRREQAISTNPYQKKNVSSSAHPQSPAVSLVSGTEIVSTARPNRQITPSDYSVAAAASSFTKASDFISPAATFSSTPKTVNNLSALPEPGVDLSVSTDSSHPPIATALPISFQQLWDLMSRAVTSEAIYRHAFGQIYVVHNLKQIGNKLYFNIEKKSGILDVGRKRSDKVSRH